MRRDARGVPSSLGAKKQNTDAKSQNPHVRAARRKERSNNKKARPQTTHPNQKPAQNFRLLSGKQDTKPKKYNQRPQSEKVNLKGSKKNYKNVDYGVDAEMEHFYNENDMGMPADALRNMNM